MVVVRNITGRPVNIKELRKTIPASNNNYVLPEKIYERYKHQLQLVNMMMNEKQASKVFKTDTKVIEEIRFVVDDKGTKYTIAPLADFLDE